MKTAPRPEIGIGILGSFQVTVGGRATATGGPKRDALLALLALHRGRAVSTDGLELDGSRKVTEPLPATAYVTVRLRDAG